jgi:hypothetical protein
MSATHPSRWVHPNGTTPTLRAVEQVRTRSWISGIIHDSCVIRCLTVLFGHNYVTVTHWLLRGPVAPRVRG